ncbi:hypothetical protein TNCV_4439031 [Trichonephila clavipes]|nr:hypothetical protein TNCV_4439031 [Trichonephila clavipes]
MSNYRSLVNGTRKRIVGRLVASQPEMLIAVNSNVTPSVWYSIWSSLMRPDQCRLRSMMTSENRASSITTRGNRTVSQHVAIQSSR